MYRNVEVGIKRIAALLTCHNRRQKTLACLESLYANVLPEAVTLHVILVDDGSSDGTGEAVNRQFPDVHLIKGDGNLYWNGGMRLAFESAIHQGFDYYLWLNDDTVLYKNALCTLLETATTVMSQKERAAIIVGTTQAHQSEGATYGGLTRASRWHPFKYHLVPITDAPVACDTMNGNCVLIPDEIVKKVGNLDAAFIHTIGDIDYGLRARNAGFQIFIMPGYAGQCDRDSIANTSSDKSLRLRDRYKKLLGKKGLPLKAWYVFTKRHAGIFWMVFWLWPALKIALSSLKLLRK